MLLIGSHVTSATFWCVYTCVACVCVCWIGSTTVVTYASRLIFSVSASLTFLWVPYVLILHVTSINCCRDDTDWLTVTKTTQARKVYRVEQTDCRTLELWSVYYHALSKALNQPFVLFGLVWSFLAWLFRFLPARCYASAGLYESNVSISLSVTHHYCIKTKKASVMISSPSGSPTINYSFLMPNFITKFERGHPEQGCETREGWVKSAVFNL